jgi:hypothetical protein
MREQRIVQLIIPQSVDNRRIRRSKGKDGDAQIVQPGFAVLRIRRHSRGETVHDGLQVTSDGTRAESGGCSPAPGRVIRCPAVRPEMYGRQRRGERRMAGIYILNLSAGLLMLFTAARFRKRCFAPAKGVVPGARGCIIWWCCEFVSHGGNRFPSHWDSCNLAPGAHDGSAAASLVDRRRQRLTTRPLAVKVPGLSIRPVGPCVPCLPAS